MRRLQLFLAILVLVPVTMAGVVYGLFLIWGRDLPTPKLPQEVEPARNTVVLDRNGEVVDEFFVQNRSPVPLAQIPEVMREAVLATEDRRFFHHWGIDIPVTGSQKALMLPPGLAIACSLHESKYSRLFRS